MTPEARTQKALSFLPYFLGSLFLEKSWHLSPVIITCYHFCGQIHDEKQLKAGRIYSGFAVFYSEEAMLVCCCLVSVLVVGMPYISVAQEAELGQEAGVLNSRPMLQWSPACLRDPPPNGSITSQDSITNWDQNGQAYEPLGGCFKV